MLHHLPVPEEGLRALREVLQPDGAMHLMVYATYGRAGVYMLQEYCRRLGVGHTDQEIRDLAVTLTALPYRHPLAHLLGESPDFRHRDALADALLNPQDRAYTVPQLFDLIDGCGLERLAGGCGRHPTWRDAAASPRRPMPPGWQGCRHASSMPPSSCCGERWFVIM